MTTQLNLLFDIVRFVCRPCRYELYIFNILCNFGLDNIFGFCGPYKQLAVLSHCVNHYIVVEFTCLMV